MMSKSFSSRSSQVVVREVAQFVRHSESGRWFGSMILPNKKFEPHAAVQNAFLVRRLSA